LKINLSCILLENTNTVVKRWVEECVSLAFLKFTIFPLLSTKYVALRTNYNIELTQHKHTTPIATKQTKQTIENSLFNILDLLRFCDKRDMARYWVKVVSRNLGNNTTEYITVKQSYCNWTHCKINFRTQVMIKTVIWIDSNAQSVCTFQL
jgi:hypothetical protein